MQRNCKVAPYALQLPNQTIALHLRAILDILHYHYNTTVVI